MFFSPVYEYAEDLFKTARYDELDRLFVRVLPTSYNVNLWMLYITYITTRCPEKILEAYEHALVHLEGHVDIPLIFNEYIALINSMHDQDTVDRKRMAYQNVIKYAVFSLPSIYRDYEDFEVGMNKFTAKTVLEKVVYNFKAYRRLTMSFDASRAIMDQVTLENCSELLEVDDRKDFVWKCLKERLFYSPEVYFEVIRISPIFAGEAIFYNSFRQKRTHADQSVSYYKEDTFTKANFFFVLLGAAMDMVCLERYMFNEAFLAKCTETGLLADSTACVSDADLKDGFRHMKKRKKDLVFIHFLASVFKKHGLPSLRQAFHMLKHIIGPLVFYYVAKLEYYLQGDIDIFINVMLLGTRRDKSLQAYMVEFLHDHRYEELARKYSAIFDRQECINGYIHLYTLERPVLNKETAARNETIYTYYYKRGIDYASFSFENSASKSFCETVSMLEFDVLKLFRHPLIIEMLEDTYKDDHLRLFDVVMPLSVIKMLQS